MTITNTTDLDGTYAFSTSRLNTLILFFKYFFLSLTSTEFYRNILSRNKESVKKHLLFCSILAGILFVCVIPIKLYGYLLVFEKFPALTYDGKYLNSPSEKSIYIFNDDTKPFAFIDTNSESHELKIEKPVLFVFSKDALLWNPDTTTYKDIESYAKIDYQRVFGLTKNTISQNKLKNTSLAILLLFVTSSPGIVLGGLFIIFLVVTISEYVLISLLLKLIASAQSKDDYVDLSKESLFRLQAFSISPCFVFIPSTMLLLGSPGLIVIVIIYFIATLSVGPIYMEHRK